MADIFNIAGRIHSTSQEEVVTTTDEILDKSQGKKQSEVNSEVGEELSLHTNRLNALTGQNYITVQATQSTTDIPTLINASGEGEQVDTIYRVGFWDGSAYVADKYTEYAWNGTAYVILDVKSSIGEVFDISQYNAVGGTLNTYVDLADALGVDGANVPSSVRRGGMSIKFVQSSDHKYVQYRFLLSSFTAAQFATPSNWQGEDINVSANQIVLEDWTANTAYIFGNQRQYDGHFYRCKTSHTSGESFDSTKWAEIDDFYIGGVSLQSINVGNVVNPLYQQCVKLVAFSENPVSDTPNIGDVVYYTPWHVLRIRIAFTGTKFKTLPFIDGAIYTYNNELYIWNGSDLVNKTQKEQKDVVPVIDSTNLVESGGVDYAISEVGRKVGAMTLHISTNDITTNKYRSSTGTKVDNNGFYLSKPIKVYAGTAFTADGVSSQSNNVSLLYKVDANNDPIQRLVLCNGAGNYSYTINEDCYVSVSSHNNDRSKMLLNIPDRIGNLETGLKGLDERVTELEESPNLFEKDLFDEKKTFVYDSSISIRRGYWLDKQGTEHEQANQYSIADIPFLSGGTYRIRLASQDVVGLTAMQAVCVYDLDGVRTAGYNATGGYYDDGTNTGVAGTYANFTIPSGGGKIRTTIYLAYSGKTDAELFEFCNLAGISNSETLGDMLRIINDRALHQSTPVDSVHLPALTQDPLEVVHYHCGLFNLWKSYGVIGDSFASGEMQGYHSDGTGYNVDMYDFSWGQQIAKMTGADVYNFSIGGLTARDWMVGNNQRTWDANDAAGGAHSNPKECYFIDFGRNDKSVVENPNRTYYLDGIGTVADINDSDPSQNADSYVGWYAKIIQSLKALEPRCCIFCITTANKSLYEDYNAQVRNIVTHFEDQRVYLIDLEEYAGVPNSQPWYFLRNHPSAAGYLFIAYEIMNYVDWIVRKNGADFIDTALVGTDIYYPSPV